MRRPFLTAAALTLGLAVVLFSISSPIFSWRTRHWPDVPASIFDTLLYGQTIWFIAGIVYALRERQSRFILGIVAGQALTMVVLFSSMSFVFRLHF